MPISFFCLYIFSLNLIFNSNLRNIIIYFFIQTFLALQYEIYTGLILTNIFIFYFLYKKKLLSKKNFQKIIITKLIICFLIFLIVFNVSNKNVEFAFNYKNIYKILLLDIYYLINSFILTFNYFLIIILFLLFLLIIKFESIKPILKKYFIYFFLSVIITVAIYNLGGYPISFSGLNGRVFLIPALYFVLIVYFILNFLNSKKKKKSKIFIICIYSIWLFKLILLFL